MIINIEIYILIPIPTPADNILAEYDEITEDQMEISASETSSSESCENALTIQCGQKPQKDTKSSKRDKNNKKDSENKDAEKGTSGARRMGLSNYRIPKKDTTRHRIAKSETVQNKNEQKGNSDNHEIVKLISNSLASQYFHSDKHKEYTKAETSGRYPQFLSPNITIKYKNDISSDILSEMSEANDTFAKTMCGLLAKHHKSMSEAQEECTKSYKLIGEKRHGDEFQNIYKSAERLALDKHIKYRCRREGPTTGAKRPRQ